MCFTNHIVVSESNPSNSGTEFSKASTSNTERASHDVTSLESELRLFFSHYRSSHNFITHAQNCTRCAFSCVSRLWATNSCSSSVNGKSTIQCHQNEYDLKLKHTPAYSTSTWFKSVVTFTDRGKTPLISKKNAAKQAIYCWLKMPFHGNLPTNAFCTVQVSGSNLHKFPHHGLMKNVTILVMGPTLGFKLAVICLLQGFCSLTETWNVCRFYVAS